MKHLQRANLRYPGLWKGCVGAWAPLLGPSGSVLRDNSGFGNTGTLTDFDLSTEIGIQTGVQAIKFDASNNRVNCGIGKSLQLQTQSFSCWVYLWQSSASTTTSILYSKDSITSDGYAWAINGDQTTNRKVGWGYYDGGVRGWYQSTSSIVKDVWTHVAGVWVPGSVKHFINGRLDATLATTSGTIVHNDAREANLGYRTFGSTRSSVWMADAMIFNRAISETEVQLLSRRPGIAYETAHRRSYKSAAATTTIFRRSLVNRTGSRGIQ